MTTQDEELPHHDRRMVRQQCSAKTAHLDDACLCTLESVGSEASQFPSRDRALQANDVAGLQQSSARLLDLEQ
eukprot:2407597-Pyramimonas_sp.AAC.1